MPSTTWFMGRNDRYSAGRVLAVQGSRPAMVSAIQRSCRWVKATPWAARSCPGSGSWPGRPAHRRGRRPGVGRPGAEEVRPGEHARRGRPGQNDTTGRRARSSPSRDRTAGAPTSSSRAAGGEDLVELGGWAGRVQRHPDRAGQARRRPRSGSGCCSGRPPRPGRGPTPRRRRAPAAASISARTVSGSRSTATEPLRSW